MKFLLTSSGLRNEHIANALQELVGKPLSETSLIFIPSAANTEGGDKGWLIDNLIDFQKAGLRSIDLLDIAAVSEENWKKRFDDSDVICFGGGNEKYLAELCEKIGMKEYLTATKNEKYIWELALGVWSPVSSCQKNYTQSFSLKKISRRQLQSPWDCIRSASFLTSTAHFSLKLGKKS